MFQIILSEIDRFS